MTKISGAVKALQKIIDTYGDLEHPEIIVSKYDYSGNAVRIEVFVNIEYFLPKEFLDD